jgi:hypothetical protein
VLLAKVSDEGRGGASGVGGLIATADTTCEGLLATGEADIEPGEGRRELLLTTLHCCCCPCVEEGHWICREEV